MSLLVAGFVLGVLMPAAAFACTVPVFRYALERWSASPYRLAVLHRGELSPEQMKALDSLYPQGAYNLSVETYDVNEALLEGIVKSYWKEESRPDKLPHGLLFVPAEMRVEQPLLWQGALDEKGIAELKRRIYSPLMRRICRALGSGDSAVWIFLKGEDEEANGRLRKLLGETLTEIQEEMRLPHELDAADTIYARPPAPGIPFQSRFSVLEADLDAPENDILKQILTVLMSSPPDLSEPMVMPVFGRSRALALLMKDDISETVFWEIGSFLVGPCSCRVKVLNPGFDLLAPFPWDTILYNGAELEKVMADLPKATQAKPADN